MRRLGILTVVVVCLSIWYSRRSAAALSTHPRGPIDKTTRAAIVVGATGATGRKLISQLNSSPSWNKVTAIVRRPTNIQDPKYHEIVVLDLMTVDKSIFEGHDVLFNCLGTTRSGGHSSNAKLLKDMGGAEFFVNVEVGMTKHVSEMAVAGGIKSASVVTAEGANHEFLKGYDWIKFIHPLLYVRTLGEKEQATINAGFQQVSIFRPGLLNRQVNDGGDFGGMFQSLQNKFDLGLKVSILAKAMLRDAETKKSTFDFFPLVYYISNGYIEQSSKL